MLWPYCWSDFSFANKTVVLVVGIVLRVPPYITIKNGWQKKKNCLNKNQQKKKNLRTVHKICRISLESIVKVHVKKGLSCRLFVILEVGELHGGAFERWTSCEAKRKDGVSDN